MIQATKVKEVPYIYDGEVCGTCFQRLDNGFYLSVASTNFTINQLEKFAENKKCLLEEFLWLDPEKDDWVSVWDSENFTNREEIIKLHKLEIVN